MQAVRRALRYRSGMEGRQRRVAVPLLIALALAGALAWLGPHAVDAGRWLAIQDDPVALADREVAARLDAGTAITETEAALAADDAELAASFVELADERGLAIPDTLRRRVTEANGAAAVAGRSAGSFAQGLITGEPEDLAGLAGTLTGDLFVFGDIRDVVREGSRFVAGQEVDQLVLGLAGVGLAITAGTYATLGAGTPARVGLTVAKAARKTGRLSAGMASWLTRSVREVVDWAALRRAAGEATLADPAAVARATRAAVKVEKAEDLLRVAGDVGRIQGRAGTRAALDGLKIAEGPRDVARLAKLAEAKGGKTRAILKVAGRSAIVLTSGLFNLVSWVFWALACILGLCSSMKGTAERLMLRHLRRKKARRMAAAAAATQMATYVRA